ncbi:hypothetical protein ONS95_005350 [Cadophora gregata]|uniref:uncharacterized protein n=1 Tax=Cadophora gregata TaxID=51156 RepID=UPI0026DB0903|nr:uncharacterized protein ONS95_005350 [Cadophora gregata]KAK0103320.1 hypothetical protein ONS95_005350 [Cadophora gregata]
MKSISIHGMDEADLIPDMRSRIGGVLDCYAGRRAKGLEVTALTYRPSPDSREKNVLFPIRKPSKSFNYAPLRCSLSHPPLKHPLPSRTTATARKPYGYKENKTLVESGGVPFSTTYSTLY